MKILGFAALALVMSTALPAAARPATSTEPVPIVMSSDVGNEIDDQWVLLHALADPAFRVLGVVSALSPPESIAAPAAQHSAIAIRQIVEDRLGLAEHPPIVTGSDLPLLDEQHARPSEGAEFLISASRGFSSSRRLTVVMTGAATDVASALLIDPAFGDRVRIIAMGFRNWREGGREFNIQNDPAAWRVILASRAPVVIGDAEVTRRDVSVSRSEAQDILTGGGALQTWLMRDYDLWFDAFGRTAEELRRPDGTQTWVIWDEVTLAYLLGYARTKTYPRPSMGSDMMLKPEPGRGTIEWVTSIDRPALWAHYSRVLKGFVRTHAVRDSPCVTFGRSPLACWRQP